jgi:hypothetical protein
MIFKKIYNLSVIIPKQTITPTINIHAFRLCHTMQETEAHESKTIKKVMNERKNVFYIQCLYQYGSTEKKIK